MGDKQPEALRLADALDSDLSAEWMQGITLKHISNELRRLHEENEALRARLAQPEQESAYGYASRLATAIWEKHYKDESPHWKVNDSLLGVLTQIDNMTTGLVRAQPEQEIELDRDHVEDDGCPTEKAVLQRFWREHQAQPERKLWLWKNFVDGRPEYWAFDNPYPTNLDNGDPQTLGQPCGYAIFKSSRDGSCGRTEEQVLREMKSVSTPPQRKWQSLTDEEIDDMMPYAHNEFDILENHDFARAIEAKLKEKNHG